MALGVVGRMRVLEVGGAGVEEGEAAGGGAACVVEVWEGRGTPLGVVYTMLPWRRVEVVAVVVVKRQRWWCWFWYRDCWRQHPSPIDHFPIPPPGVAVVQRPIGIFPIRATPHFSPSLRSWLATKRCRLPIRLLGFVALRHCFHRRGRVGVQGLAVVAELAETTLEDVPHEWDYSLKGGARKGHAGVYKS